MEIRDQSNWHEDSLSIKRRLHRLLVYTLSATHTHTHTHTHAHAHTQSLLSATFRCFHLLFLLILCPEGLAPPPLSSCPCIFCSCGFIAFICYLNMYPKAIIALYPPPPGPKHTYLQGRVIYYYRRHLFSHLFSQILLNVKLDVWDFA